jgi:hypothetical protein
LEQPRQRKICTKFITLNVRIFYRAVSLKTVACELAKVLDVVSVKEVRWVEGGSQPADDYTFCYGNGNANHHLETDFSCVKKLDQQLKG